ncbi:MAG TPA: tRNA uridine-5-carboxymethylaminomethyl(34) synthesis GTPase MnmE [Mollicutes bacterium]|nr:tRNA uridine-5-carboxymethylaminomethyl(34) synthesis GTPase MnmE [Mollicutes bacterium]
MEKTICAISTAPLKGAISIIRVSGKDAIKIVNSVFSGADLSKVKSHTIHYGYISHNNEKIDEVLVTVMKSPRTFTTEDTVEINTHGGIAPTNKVLEILLNNGCELAEPGEFTKRAFLNGRIDLIKAEAISDLINSETEKARKLAVNQIRGTVTKKIEDLRSSLISLMASIEVNIDYPEYDDAEEITKEVLLPSLKELNIKLVDLIKESENGKIINQGINVAIIGAPNVGKSSILNALIEEEKAIVTNIPGTTRDIVEGKISLNGIILNIIDTAGIRTTTDLVEQIGVEKSLKVSKEADLVIYVIDNTKENINEDIEQLKEIKDSKVLVFVNKDDLESKIKKETLKDYHLVTGNTVKEDGLKDLKNKIIELFNIDYFENTDYTFLSSAKHISLAKKAKNSIDNAINNLNEGILVDMVSIDLKESYDYLSEIIGEKYKDDLLDELFSKFCLGK